MPQARLSLACFPALGKLGLRVRAQPLHWESPHTTDDLFPRLESLLPRVNALCPLLLLRLPGKQVSHVDRCVGWQRRLGVLGVSME